MRCNNIQIKSKIHSYLNLRLIGKYGIQHFYLPNSGTFLVKKQAALVFFNDSIWNIYKASFLSKLYGVSRNWWHLLKLKGTGYKLYQIGRVLILKWGFSHLIALRLPAPLNIKIDRTTLKLECIDFYLLKQVSHVLKNLRKLDLYRGKGLYEPDLELRLKLGKVWQR